MLCTRSVRAGEHTGVGTSSPGQRGEVCGGGLVTACVIAAGGCVGRRRAPSAAVNWRLLVAESSGRSAAPGPGYGAAAVAGGDCLVGGRRSSHAPHHAAERTGPRLGSVGHFRACARAAAGKNPTGELRRVQGRGLLRPIQRTALRLARSVRALRGGGPRGGEPEPAHVLRPL